MKIGSEKMYYKTVAPDVDKAVQTVTDEFLLQCRLKTADRHNVRVVIDAGWSHPGWWARECTVIGLDGQTGLPLAVFHVIKEVNFKGSSKGIYIYFNFNFKSAMEGFGVKQIMQQLKEAGMTVTQIVHDKDASTMTQVMTVFEDVEECLCLSNFLIF